MRKREFIRFENLEGVISRPAKDTQKMIILLHGVGSNEKDLVEVGETIAPDSIVVSLRAPIALSHDSFAWFNVQFMQNGPVHNWEETEKSFKLLETEILSLSKRYNIALENIDVLGFSQGSIMALGLLLQSPLQLGHYLCFSGRTLPEFSHFSSKHPERGYVRKIFLAHGLYDDRLPVSFGRLSKELLIKLKADISYHEFSGGHSIPPEIIEEAKKWLNEN